MWRAAFVERGALRSWSTVHCELGTWRIASLERGALQSWSAARCKLGTWRIASLERGALQFSKMLPAILGHGALQARDVACCNLGTWRVASLERGALQSLNVAPCKPGTWRAAILECGTLQAWNVAQCNPRRWRAAILKGGSLQTWNVARSKPRMWQYFWGCSESPARPVGGHLLQRTGRTGPGGTGSPAQGVFGASCEGQWGAIFFREPGAPAWGGRGVLPRGCSESPASPVGGHLLQKTGRTGPGGTGSPAQGVFGVSCQANGGPSSSENRAHRPGGDGESCPGGVRSLRQDPWVLPPTS